MACCLRSLFGGNAQVSQRQSVILLFFVQKQGSLCKINP